MPEETTAGGLPKWVWIAAIVGVILVLFVAHQKTAAATPAGIIAAPVDPNAAAITEAQSAASLGAFQSLVQGVTAIDTNANTNAAGLAGTQNTNATLRALGSLQLKATQSNNETTLSVAKVNATAATQQTIAKTAGGVLGALGSVLAIFGL